MRASQPWNMRYPLTEVEGSNGDIKETGNWSAPRYTSTRLTALAEYLFNDIKKNTIDEWRDNYDDTEQYPAVLPSKGFYNLVNGTTGISVGLASSIPSFNLRELNKALITLLNNPDCSFEDIYCVPDFAGGAYLTNEPIVKECLRNGSGGSCAMRSKMEYDAKSNTFTVLEVPPMVYTGTIKEQIVELLDKEDNPGIESCNDLSGATPEIKIYLAKGANPKKVEKYLYANTSLQDYYGINLTILGSRGRFPKVYTWKELLQEHINHEKEVYRRGFEFDLQKVNDRLHIIEGILIAIARVEEVIALIKKSSSTAEACTALQEHLLLDEVQAKAVLAIKLSQIARLEAKKYENERTSLLEEKQRLKSILSNEQLLNKEIEKGFREVMDKFGDERRTKVIRISEEKEEKIADIVPEECVITLTSDGMIKRTPANQIKLQNRGGRGSKNQDGNIINSIRANTIDNLMIFTQDARCYSLGVDDVPEKAEYTEHQNIATIATISRISNENKYVFFATKNGLIKKVPANEYIGIKRKSGIAATVLREGDELRKVFVGEDTDMLIVTKSGMCIRFGSETLNPLSRISVGVKGISLSNGDEVVDMIPVGAHKEVILFSADGGAKRVAVEDFTKQARAGKGLKTGSRELSCALGISGTTRILVIGDKNSICINSDSVAVTNRTGSYVSVIKNNKIMKVAEVAR